MPVLSDFCLGTQEERILKRLDFGLGLKPNLDVRKRLKELNADTGNLISPSIAYDIFEVVKIEPESIVLKKERIEGSLLPALFEECKFLMVAVCTIGPQLEEKVEQLINEGNLLNAMLIDEVGNASINELEDECLRVANEKADEEGLKASGCVCPGKEGFTLDEQAKILKMVNAQEIGVRLTDSRMMYPRKSTSLVIGIGTNLGHWDMCEYCEMRDRCSYNN
ncbi:MAG: hypothetical protein ACLFVI_05330 [Archaeoglobaceae archaeon]